MGTGKETFDRVNLLIGMIDQGIYEKRRFLYELSKIREFVQETKADLEPSWFKPALKLTKLLVCGIIVTILVARGQGRTETRIKESIELCNQLVRMVL